MAGAITGLTICSALAAFAWQSGDFFGGGMNSPQPTEMLSQQISGHEPLVPAGGNRPIVAGNGSDSVPHSSSHASLIEPRRSRIYTDALNGTRGSAAQADDRDHHDAFARRDPEATSPAWGTSGLSSGRTQPGGSFTSAHYAAGVSAGGGIGGGGGAASSGGTSGATGHSGSSDRPADQYAGFDSRGAAPLILSDDPDGTAGNGPGTSNAPDSPGDTQLASEVTQPAADSTNPGDAPKSDSGQPPASGPGTPSTSSSDTTTPGSPDGDGPASVPGGDDVRDPGSAGSGPSNSQTPRTIPEPLSIVLLGSGLAGVAWRVRARHLGR
jgi:hypothetical protein